MNIAIILAGGAGKRLKTEIPKQFIEIGGKKIIEYTLDIFEQHSQIDEIAIVINAQFIQEMDRIVQNGGYKKVKRILQGGAERQDSSWVAINACKEVPNANLIIHDAVRPMIDADIITKMIKKLENYSAVTTAVPTTDTIYQVEENHIQYIPDRKYLMRAQTPQGFKQHIIQKAYQEAFRNKDYSATDDCGVVVKYLPRETIYVVAGNERNIKVTHKEDLYVLGKMIQSKNQR
ncbi:MAG: 2-C-methyl-D-erythritol 4-phosphate cytidylyltransferase [Bacteroidetes bacterium]|nr:2-C-methyl-D-erythritol 4-phosphate cytidylyltransferase [Bacteroidota bacterium]MCL1968786.1 2-C-methyl-D-erythritol 4-phosphate cytidylyltransferase [Bacteroidota bacterium]